MHESRMHERADNTVHANTACDITAHVDTDIDTHTHTHTHTPHGKFISKQDGENCRNIWLLTVTKWQCRLSAGAVLLAMVTRLEISG